MIDFRLEPIGFEAIPGWADDDHAAALAAFARSAPVLQQHPPKPRQTAVDVETLTGAIREAAGRDWYPDEARHFFETRFVPHRVVADDRPGFFTGYYEPVVDGSRTRTEHYRHPLLARPSDLVDVPAISTVPGLEPGTRFARLEGERLAPYPDRGEIMGGCLDGRGLELVWLADPVDAFYIHIQGSARVRLPDGSEIRLTYAAKSGHPYTAIGRVLIDEGHLPPGGADMAAIRKWLAANPDEVARILARNRSYIFFREAPVDDPALGPVAAARVPLTPGRSLAVDRMVHTFHVPVFVDTELADGTPFRRLMVAQDTGSAIVGPARGDIFLGSGDAAGAAAGALQARGGFVVFMPGRATP